MNNLKQHLVRTQQFLGILQRRPGLVGTKHSFHSVLNISGGTDNKMQLKTKIHKRTCQKCS